NYISFDAGFASVAGAQGLLTVYADGAEIGVLDELFAPPGAATYRMGTGGGLDAGAHLFAFRLDELAGIQSSLDVSSIATGSAEFIVESVSGAVAGEHAGWAIANAGDVDRDGYDDIIIGAPFNDENGAAAGKIYVLSARTGDLLFDVLGTPGSRHGWSVAGAGDVNLDGHADVIAGAPFHNSKRGRAYVYSGADGQELFRKLGSGNGDQLGYAVSGGVDFNDDGHDDVVFAAPWNDDAAKNAGQVQVYSGANGRRIGALLGERKNDRFGTSVAALANVDGDGSGDFVVGAPMNDDSGKNAGKVYVYSGSDRSLLYTRTGMRAGDQFGRSVAAAGLVDANDRDDFVVGAPLFDKTGASNSGRVFLYSGHTGGQLWAKNGQAANDRSGWSVAGAGDVDGDGVDDILVGAYLHDTAGVNAGRAYIRSGVNGAALDILDGASDDDLFGLALSGIGDVNDDGFDDVLVAAPRNDTIAADSGRVDVFLSPYGPGMAPAMPYPLPDDDAPADYALSGSATSGETASPSRTGLAALQHVLEHWGPCGSAGAGCPGDLNGDGTVDALDLRLALALFQETPDDLAAESGDEDLQIDKSVGITFVNDDVLAPREHGGVFTVSDEYAQTTNGVLAIEIAGPVPVEQHDLLVVADRAWLGGELVVVFGDGFEPGPGDAFTIIAAGSIDGRFDHVELPQVQRDLAAVLRYEDTTVALCIDFADESSCQVTSIDDQAVNADLTEDGLVDVRDLLAVLRAWGERSDEADLNQDGSVDGLDLLALLDAWED
ncbi:MAG: integrin alpha, partial [Planctomycetota bacterium]